MVETERGGKEMDQTIPSTMFERYIRKKEIECEGWGLTLAPCIKLIKLKVGLDNLTHYAVLILVGKQCDQSAGETG